MMMKLQDGFVRETVLKLVFQVGVVIAAVALVVQSASQDNNNWCGASWSDARKSLSMRCRERVLIE